jgi:hypothetical protein
MSTRSGAPQLLSSLLLPWLPVMLLWVSSLPVEATSPRVPPVDDLRSCVASWADVVHVPSRDAVASAYQNLADPQGLACVLVREGMLPPSACTSAKFDTSTFTPWARDAINESHIPFWRIERSAAATQHCASIGPSSSLAAARETVLGILPRMVLLGYGGTRGGVDRGSPADETVEDPPLSGGDVTADDVVGVTESVITHFGASLSLRPFIVAANLLIQRPPQAAFVPQAKTLKAKSVVERSASFYDPVTRVIHIARVRWVHLRFLGHVNTVFPKLLRAYSDHTVSNSATRRHYAVSASNITRGYVSMSGGEWDMQFMAGKPSPGMKAVAGLPTDQAVQQAMEYWRQHARDLAQLIANASLGTGNSLARTPVFWRDQPLPPCNSRRYTRPEKASMKCTTVLRPVVVPGYRTIIREELQATTHAITFPVDLLLAPDAPFHASSAALTSTLPDPPPWYRPGTPLLCTLGDGGHLEAACMYLELVTYWAFATAIDERVRRKSDTTSARVAAAAVDSTASVSREDNEKKAASDGNASHASSTPPVNHQYTPDASISLARGGYSSDTAMIVAFGVILGVFIVVVYRYPLQPATIR